MFRTLLDHSIWFGWKCSFKVKIKFSWVKPFKGSLSPTGQRSQTCSLILLLTYPAWLHKPNHLYFPYGILQYTTVLPHYVRTRQTQTQQILFPEASHICNFYFLFCSLPYTLNFLKTNSLRQHSFLSSGLASSSLVSVL